MGPYKSFNLNYVLSEDERRDIYIEDLPGPLRRLFKREDDINAAQALLRRVQGALRTNSGVNAFLALDVDVDTADVGNTEYRVHAVQQYDRVRGPVFGA
jgi:hypothetical protein